MVDSTNYEYEIIIPAYLEEVSKLNKESARSHRFSLLFQDLFHFEPELIESYVSGIEKSVSALQKDRLVRGEIDNLFGNIIIEFESNLLRKRKEAEEQIRRYAAILWSGEPPLKRRPYLGLATDGIHFIVYSILLADENQEHPDTDEVTLKVLEETDWSKLPPTQVVFWLDRYLLRKVMLVPTTETILKDFGLESHAFQTSSHHLLNRWNAIKTDSNFAVVRENWEKYLHIVYGPVELKDELFIRHTYLATLAKLLAWMRISEDPWDLETSQMSRLLEGELFRNQGIENLIEEDFFSWIIRDQAEDAGAAVTRLLLNLLRNYELQRLSEDVLKALYQELVDPETRHDLGEFYTPDWLAHRIINHLFNQKPDGSVLDPACGSGTFLYLAIQEKRAAHKDSPGTLSHILQTVCGADIHPLAVMVAKCNYLLALGDLIKKRGRPIHLPVYLADTLKLPQRFMAGRQYEFQINSTNVFVNEELLTDMTLFDDALEQAKNYARDNRHKKISMAAFQAYLRAQHFPKADHEEIVSNLFEIAETLKEFVDADRDTIWAFILKNIYRPLFYRNYFDFVAGNPPWISFRFLDPDYQTFIKNRVTKDYRLLSGRGELITHLEVASIFLLRAADLYLKRGGTIAFVLPRSLFTADQHDAIRKRSFRLNEDPLRILHFKELWDCEQVMPVFNVPCCVAIAERGEYTDQIFPIPGQVFQGNLKRKNASLQEARKALQITPVKFQLHQRGKRSFWAPGSGVKITAESYYLDKFSQGAAIVPRSFWFVEVKPFALGINPTRPLVQTSDYAKKEAKKPYQDIDFKENVEPEFFYATVLSSDLLPFGTLRYRMMVLPLLPERDHHRLVTAEEAHKTGYYYLERWLQGAEKQWHQKRGQKAGKSSLIEWLDYRKKLTSQNSKAKFRVLYNTSGTHLAACVIRNKTIKFEVDGQFVEVKQFVADTKTYFSELGDKQEAYYLAAVLNAPYLNELIKPMQSRGLWGPRDIHKKVLELPIPQFNAKKSIHIKLSKLGLDASIKVEKWIKKEKPPDLDNIGKLRNMVRELLHDELAEIDALVKKIID